MRIIDNAAEWNVTSPTTWAKLRSGTNVTCSNYCLQPGSSCFCVEYDDQSTCTYCCITESQNCCQCEGCTGCWSEDNSLKTMTQVTAFILFMLSIVFVIIMYCRICNRTSRRRSSRQTVLDNEHNQDCTDRRESPYYTIPVSRERPPSYSEACSAPPLYTSPYNRVSMLEAPPVYPETPKLSERVDHSTTPAAPTVAHHI